MTYKSHLEKALSDSGLNNIEEIILKIIDLLIYYKEYFWLHNDDLPVDRINYQDMLNDRAFERAFERVRLDDDGF